VAIVPKFLQKGNTLAAISPAGPVEEKEVAEGVLNMGNAGYEVSVLPSALNNIGYLAGTDEERAKDLVDAFQNSKIDGILCTRGGYGTMRLLQHVDFSIIKNNPKPLIGFSDISALQHAIWLKTGLVTYSGPQLARGGLTNPDEEGLDEARLFNSRCWFDLLEGKLQGKALPFPADMVRLESVKCGSVTSPLLGGNLAVLSALAGTRWSPIFKDSILLLEEIDEPLYRIDRMLSQLHLAGAFEGVKGVLLGKFTQHIKGEPVQQHDEVLKIIREFLPDDIPFSLGAPYGHIGPCWTLPLGATVTLDSNRGMLIIEE